MIDLRNETLMSLPQARAWLASRGVKRDRGSLYRWAELGQLETVRFGGRLYTSVEALERMCQPAPSHTKQARRRPAGVEDDPGLDEYLRKMRAI